MIQSLQTVRTIADLRALVRSWRAQGLTSAFVPTMGALHQGHMTLVRAGLAQADRVVASVFVNPTQFGPNEDFDRYPRQEAEDARLLAETGAHLLFAPSVQEMYPAGAATTVSVKGLSDGLCGAARPGHFDGVATVVTKLLLQAGTDLALFGEKDWQQLAIIRQLVRDLNIPVQVVGVPTVREADGLALSSRNAYLTPEQRRVAPALHAALIQVANDLKAGQSSAAACHRAIAQLLAAGFQSVDYLEVRSAQSLAPLDRLDGDVRILAAARLGATRLIDNIGVM